MESIRLEETGSGRVLKLCGGMNIDEASRLRDVMLGVLDSGKGLLLDLRDVEEIDLACVQVICAAHRSFLTEGLKISLTGSDRECLRRSLSDMAMHVSACDPPLAGQCLWAAGESHV